MSKVVITIDDEHEVGKLHVDAEFEPHLDESDLVHRIGLYLLQQAAEVGNDN